ncbi:MAG: hypothetical protein GY793_09170 [Proteobacteria bacterium]|nr:hypothetical protein [Pseudomonadota bacterium]
MLNKIITISVFAFLSACNNNADTIAGTDKNSNGVRDDIDHYINKTYSIKSQYAAAIQEARAFQEVLLVDKTNIDEVRKVNRKLSRAMSCTYMRFNGNNNSKHPAAVSTEIEDLTINTRKRKRAYREFSKALDGTAWSLPTGNTCE